MPLIETLVNFLGFDPNHKRWYDTVQSRFCPFGIALMDRS
jgi:hypothetical protein